jgi:hypothetical protein
VEFVVVHRWVEQEDKRQEMPLLPRVVVVGCTLADVRVRAARGLVECGGLDGNPHESGPNTDMAEALAPLSERNTAGDWTSDQ